MFLAHLRGLLKPYYDQGARSIIAETAMLRTLAASISAEYEAQALLAESGFAGNARQVREFYASITGGFANVLDRAMLDFTRTSQRSRTSAKGLVALFEELRATGFFEQLNESTEKALRESSWKRH
jgi:hypothetical protein